MEEPWQEEAKEIHIEAETEGIEIERGYKKRASAAKKPSAGMGYCKQSDKGGRKKGGGGRGKKRSKSSSRKGGRKAAGNKAGGVSIGKSSVPGENWNYTGP